MVFGFFRKRRRARLRDRPFPDAWEAMLQRNLRDFARLSEDERAELRHQVQVFLAEKNFEGCGGMVVTDSMRVTVAAHACLLVLAHRPVYDYPGLGSVLIYPDAFVVHRDTPDEAGVVADGPDTLEGESWYSGAIIFSWADGKLDREAKDGRNIFYHEFSHQLFDAGLPGFPSDDVAQAFARVFEAEYEAHVQAVTKGRGTSLEPYGAESLAEFFAVSTEAFFDTPRRLKHVHPTLYGALLSYYQQDPLAPPRPQSPSP